MDEIVQEFLIESHENVEAIERDLMVLEDKPTDQDAISSCFRALHTIKGTAGMLGYSRLEELTHAAENVLDRVRDGAVTVTSDLISTLLETLDVVKGSLEVIENTEEDSTEEHPQLLASLKRFLSEPAPAPEPAAHPASPEPAPAERAAVQPDETVDVNSRVSIIDVMSDPPPVSDVPTMGEILERYGVSREAILDALRAQEKGDPRRLGDILVRRQQARPAQIEQALREQRAAKEASSGGTSAAESVVRVNVEILDALMNLVGELVLVRNQILQQSIATGDTQLVSSTHRLNLVTTELQERVMKTRMQAIGTVWNKFPRIVRDLAKGLKKNVRIEMEGQDTEIDRTIIEAIKDPLTHLVRNAIDHGMERADERATVGKPEQGVLKLSAYHEGGQVNIEIADDGKGIDLEKIKARAIQRDLVTESKAANLSEREILDFIFTPGFSTAEQVTHVSGRGVGMDVVKTNIERIGGTIETITVLGKGTRFRVRIPLTLAIIPALTVESEGDRFAIPQINLVELVRLEDKQIAKIEYVGDAPVYRLRGELLPLVFLSEQLKQAEVELSSASVVNIVVVQADHSQFGIVVDAVYDTEEIVVKPLGAELKYLDMYAGATIMGDGRVALIIDVAGIANRAHVQAVGGPTVREPEPTDDVSIAHSLLLVESGAERRFAVPLELVDRIEDVTSDRIERVGDQFALQYRGAIMPIIRLDRVMGIEADEPHETFPVVVFKQSGRTFGLAASRLVDIVEDRVVMDSSTARDGIRGTAIVRDRIVELLDLRRIAEMSAPWLNQSNGSADRVPDAGVTGHV